MTPAPEATAVPRPVGRATQALVDRLGVRAAVILTIVVGLALAGILAWLFSEVYENVTDRGTIERLDVPVLQEAVALRTPGLNTALTVYTNVAGVIAMPILAVATMVALALRRRSWTPVVVLGTAGVGSLLMTVTGKELFGRDRPAHRFAVPPYESSPSFPSGHTLNATVIAGAVAYLLIQRQSSRSLRALTIVAAVVFAFTIGLSRVYLGHHWLTDVMGAWVLALAWLALVVTVHRAFLTVKVVRDADRLSLP